MDATTSNYAQATVALSKKAFANAAPGFAVRALLDVRRGLLRLARALGPAELTLYEHASHAAVLPLLTALIRLGVPEALGDSAAQVATLAAARGLDADALERALRFLAVFGYFRFERDGSLRHTAQSRLLRGGRASCVREFLLYYGSASNMAAWSQVDHALCTGQSPFERVHGMNVWQWFDAHDDEREIFAHAMTGLTSAQAPVIASLYPFRELTNLCDVGGGRGTLISELLIRHPHLSGVLCDSAPVLASATALLRARGVSDRVVLSERNFFESVPPGADAYVLKNVLHDWDDDACRKILKVVRTAADERSRVLIAELLVDRSSSDPLGRTADVQMMVACSGGRERDLPAYRALLARAGFRLQRTFMHPLICVLEAIPV